MRIQHNITAVNAYRQLGGNNTQVGKNLEKLSSGYRINRAGDDAAGLAISEKMRSQIKGLDTAQKNSNDGISLVQTAEGALTEVHSMLNRMTELATQSANGTYDNKTDRANLQKEVDSLVSEIDRISESTNFNGINLLDGSLAGAGSSGSNLTGAKIVDYKAAAISAAGTDMGSFDFAANGIETINVDGVDIKVDWSTLKNKELLKQNWTTDSSAGPSAAAAGTAAQMMQDHINAAIDASGKNVAHISVTAMGKDDAKDAFKFTSGSTDKESKIQFKSSTGVGGALVGSANSTGGATASVASGADMNGTFQMNIDGMDFAITTSGLTSTSSDIDVKNALKTAIGNTIDKYNDGKIESEKLKASDFTVDITKDGRLAITNNSKVKIGFSDVEGSNVAEKLGISTNSKTSGSGLSLQIGDTADAFNQVTVSVGSMSSSSLGISSLNIAEQGGAKVAMAKIKDAINSVSSTRGDLGAIQNRLEHTINNLGVTSENMTAAESRIRDVDMAKEMMDFTKNNILTQAAQSMLAQANQIPQGVLQLLQ